MAIKIESASCNPLQEFVLTSKMLSVGIVPIEKVTHDISRAFKNVSSDEARVLKRKFRKMWRKELKSKISNIRTGKDVPKVRRRAEDGVEKLRKDFGVGEKNPSRKSRAERKLAVYDKIWNEDVLPAMEKLTK